MPKLTDVSKYRTAFTIMVTTIQHVLDCLTPKMKELRFHETFVTVYQSTWHNIPEDLNV